MLVCLQSSPLIMVQHQKSATGAHLRDIRAKGCGAGNDRCSCERTANVAEWEEDISSVIRHRHEANSPGLWITRSMTEPMFFSTSCNLRAAEDCERGVVGAGTMLAASP